MADYSKLVDLAEKVLRSYPDFALDHNASQIPNFIVIKIRRNRRAYGSFVDTDKVRQVQRDIVKTLRSYNYPANLGRDEQDEFTVTIETDDDAAAKADMPKKEKSLSDHSGSYYFSDLDKKKKPIR